MNVVYGSLSSAQTSPFNKQLRILMILNISKEKKTFENIEKKKK